MIQDGKKHIENILRVVKDHNWHNNPSDRPSIGGEGAYISLIQNIYESSTPQMQKMFKNLNRIYIETDMKVGAYAQLYRGRSGATLGLRKLDIDLNSSLGDGLSRKEQLCFGRQDCEKNINKELPYYTSEDVPNLNNYLYYVIAHEFGHLLDWKNNISVIEKDSSWASYSWKDEATPISSQDFEGRTKFKFYNATEKTLKNDDYPQFYQNLYNSNFVSAYSTLDPDEDFAETFAHINVFKVLGAKLSLHIPKEGISYDISERISSGLLSKKVDHIETFLDTNEIVYP